MTHSSNRGRTPPARKGNVLPPCFQEWFRDRGWTPHDYQLTMFDEPARGALLPP